jgi:hypothetical protein
MITQKNRLPGIMVSAVILLLIPLIAMQFTNEVRWSVPDFVAAAILLFATGLACELVMRKVKKIQYRVIICSIVFLAFFLIWAELAVGIFGSAIAGS